MKITWMINKNTFELWEMERVGDWVPDHEHEFLTYEDAHAALRKHKQKLIIEIEQKEIKRVFK